MSENSQAERFFSVICLHCSRPFRISLRDAQAFAAASQPGESDGAGTGSHHLFLAWCPACHHEAPYTASDIQSLPASSARREESQKTLPAFERAVGAS
jgi:hypothetical protein